MAKDRIDGEELANKPVEEATSAEDPLRAIVEMIADYVMEAEVTAKGWRRAARASSEWTTYRNGHHDWLTSGPATIRNLWADLGRDFPAR